MDKKDIYEHLAKIYLDASLKRKKNTKEFPLFKILFFISIAFTLSLTVFLVTNFNKNKLLDYQVALVLSPDAVKINFHFNPAKKEIYSLDLNNFNMAGFRALAFSAKTAGYKDDVSLRVEFINRFKEKSEVYLKEISHKWKDYQIGLSEFKNISDWLEMAGLAFIVEEWNAKNKAGVIYIDNVRLLR